MDPREAEELTQGLGQVHAGSWRVTGSLIRLGVPKALGLTDEQWVQERLGGTVRMAVGERRIAVRELADEGMTQRQIAATLGVTQPLVSSDINSDKNLSDQPKKRRSKADGDKNLSDNTAELERLRKQNAELERKLADASKPEHPGTQVGALQRQIAELQEENKKQKQDMMQLSGTAGELEETLKKVATTNDEREQQQIALAALNKVGQAVTARAAARISASQVAWDIRSLNQKLDTLIQGKGDDISDNDAAAIIRDFNELAQTVQVLKSRVEINKL